MLDITNEGVIRDNLRRSSRSRMIPVIANKDENLDLQKLLGLPMPGDNENVLFYSIEPMIIDEPVSTSMTSRTSDGILHTWVRFSNSNSTNGN